MSAYSGTPLVRKLGLKPGMRVRLYDAPEGYWQLLGDTPAALALTALSGHGDEPADFAHLFAKDAAALGELLGVARQSMTENGVIWVSWPKKSSGVASEIGRAEVMAAGTSVGLVDVKVCAVDETWSGLKFVIPVAERA